MKKTLLFSFLFFLFVNISFGQSTLWTKTSENKLKSNEKMDRDVHPSKFQLFQSDFNALFNSKYCNLTSASGFALPTIAYVLCMRKVYLTLI